MGRGPTDRGRRERIARAALDVALERGVAAVSHRAVAQAAGVPLGSTTYHFATLDDLLLTAIERATEDYRDDLRRWSTTVGARGADLADAICAHVRAALGRHRRRTQAKYDLYISAMHRPALAGAARAWAAATREELERHAGPRAARALTVVLDGIFVGALVGDEVLADDEVRALVRAVLDTEG
jgi:DNA-binding transcriptional regulator YbjK